MRVHLNRKAKASYEMVRSFCNVIADGRSHWYKFDTAKVRGDVLCYPDTRRYTIIFTMKNSGGKSVQHSRTAHNPVTTCDTLTALGITSFDMLVCDDPKSRKVA
jgi:hypothetical protein